jgi:hypothetical protein
MADISLVDVTVHFDPELTAAARGNIESAIRALDGVVSVHMPDDKPHLAVVEYNPERVNSQTILELAAKQDGHAELVGL